MVIPDHETIDLSYPRQLVGVEELTKTIISNIPGVDPRVAHACAANIITGLPFLGLPPDPAIDKI